MTGAEILTSLFRLGQVLKAFDLAGGRKKALATKAAMALSEAVASTRDAVARRGAEDDGTNFTLTNLWFQASLAYREAGEVELSRLCQIKGNYWTQPSNWTDVQIQERGIQLTRMQRELQRLLAGG